MAFFYNSVLDIEECVSKVFNNRDIAAIENICTLSAYTEEELRNAVEEFYNNRRKPYCSDLLSYYIEDMWFWKLLYAFKFYKNVDNGERIVNFLNEYNLTVEFIDALIRRHPIQSDVFYFFRASLVNYYNRKEKYEKQSQNEKLTKAFNLDVRRETDNLSGKINCIKISNRFISQETLKSLGIHCVEVELVKNQPERLAKNLKNIDAGKLRNIGDDGIVKVGSFVRGGDILVAKERPTSKDRFGQMQYCNSSVSLSSSLEGVVVDVQVKSKTNGDLLKGRTDALIQVYIEIQLPVKKGDVLIDKFGNSGIVVGVVDNEDTDIVANFHFNGDIVKRLGSPRLSHILHVRGGANGQYSEFDDSPIGNGLNSPIVLTKPLVKKLVQNDCFSVLQDIMFITSYGVRNEVKLFETHAEEICNICNKNTIVKFVELGRAAGFDINIYSQDNSEFKYEKIINAPDLKVKISPMTNDKIDKMSNGEINSAETFNYKTLERVKGGLWDKEIFGEKALEMRHFMGHIKLPISYCNPIFPYVKLNKILVYPVSYRWINPNKTGFTVANWSQEAYSVIINQKKNLEYLIKNASNEDENTLQTQKAKLNNTIDGYFISGLNNYCGLLSDYFDSLKNCFVSTTIDYCASMRAIVSNDIQTGECLLPWNIIKTIFQNIIPIWLSCEMDGATPAFYEEVLIKIFGDEYQPSDEDIKRRKIEEARTYFIKNQNDNTLIKKINKFLQNEHVFVMTKNDDGEIIKLIPQTALEDYNDAAIVLNPTDYVNLSIKGCDPIIVIYDPIDCGIKQKIDKKRKSDFFTFIDGLTNDKITKYLLPKLFSRCIDKVNASNITDSLAFCLLTGRRASGGVTAIAKDPFIEFSYPEFSKQAIKDENSGKDMLAVHSDLNSEELSDEDFDFEDIDIDDLLDDE